VRDFSLSLREVDEFRALLGYYASYNVIPHRRFGTTSGSRLQGSVVWNHLQVLSLLLCVAASFITCQRWKLYIACT